MRREIWLATGALATAFLLAQKRRRRSDSRPEAVVRNYFKAWEDGSAEELRGLVDRNYSGHVHALAGTEDRDRDTLTDQAVAHAKVFGERRFEVKDTVASGDEVAARVHVRAIHAESDRAAEMDGLVLFKLAKGRIVEEWSSWDYLGLAQQLGLQLDGSSNGGGAAA
ncbi:MAG TPA: ester cyclase [Gaiellaceae bacterium]